MKITFICGSLEPGKDGVGDYTRRLAGELIRQSNNVEIISINDKYLQDVWEGVQNDGGEIISILRLPSSQPWHLRLKKAKVKIDVFDPNWVSLQYVPFSFQKKGLPFWLANKLNEINKGRPWHIMFHELWVGMSIQASNKDIYWGKLQAFLIKQLVQKLKPKVIHTNSHLYLAQLNKINFQAKHLPLFSNIPTIIKRNVSNTIKDKQRLSFIVFGTIHPKTYIDDFISEIKRYKHTKQIEVVVKLVGRCGKEEGKWKQLFSTANLEIEILGEQSQQAISQLLSIASLGISTSALVVIEKSGTVAAMLEHGLPVLCIAKGWIPRGLDISLHLKSVYEFSKGCLDLCLEESNTNITDLGLEYVAKKFIQDLQLSNNNI